LIKGNFNAGGSGSAILAEAVARVKGISVDEAEAWLDGLSEEQTETVNANSAVKATLVIIRGERAQAKLATIEDTLDF